MLQTENIRELNPLGKILRRYSKRAKEPKLNGVPG
jgi:hypothetical protein